MKLKTIALITVLSLPLLALADTGSTNSFAGFYAGLGVGYMKQTLKATVPSVGFSQTASKTGGVAEISLGYNYALDSDWLMGIDAYFAPNNIDIAANVPNIPYTAEMKRSYGADALLGYAFSPRVMVSAGPGLVLSKIKVGGSASDSRTYLGFKGTVGVQEALTKTLSLKESLSYIQYQDRQLVHPLAKVEPIQYTGLVSLIYTFHC